MSRARVKSIGTDAEPGAVARLIGNAAGDAIFAEGAGEVFGHGLIFAGPDFRGRLAWNPNRKAAVALGIETVMLVHR